MNLRILSWNVRGFNNPHKRDTVENLLKDWKCKVVCFQETKLASTNSATVKSLWGSSFVEWGVFRCHSHSGRYSCDLGHKGV